MQIVSRADVGFDPPIQGPTFEPRLVDGIVWHWAGSYMNLALGEERMLRQMQTSYVNVRGYSLGYSFAVGPSGRIYEIRGLTFRPASNGDVNTNSRAPSVLVMTTNMGDDITPAQLASLRWLTGYIVSQVPNAVKRYGHRDLNATQCPGDRFYSYVKDGVFEPQKEDKPMAAIYVKDPERDAIYAAVEGVGRFWAREVPNVQILPMPVAEQRSRFGVRLGALPEESGYPKEAE